MAVTFHLTPQECWLRQSAGAIYQPEAFIAEGFIHCTDGEDNVVAVGNRYYTGDPREMVCLVIDRDTVTAEIRYEDSARTYPHIYGPLNIDAVCDVRAVERTLGGVFARIGDSIQR